jgi:outer membrane cobalamin receptor
MKLTRFILACVLVVIGAPTLRAGAQTQPVHLDTIQVEVNSRASPALGSTTRAIDVIVRDEIRNSPAANIAEVLHWAFGVDLMPRSPALYDVAIRGSSFEQVLVLVDGVRMRDGQTGHFNLNLTVPLEQVERIEVLRGPASALYGSDALAGVINIVTRRGGSGSSASLSMGSFGTTDARLGHHREIGRARVDVAGTYQTSDGHRSGTDYEMANVRLSVSAPIGGHLLSTEAAYALRDFGADGFYGDWPSFEATRTTTASARWRVELDSAHSVEPLVSYRRNSDDFILYRDEPERFRNLHTTDQLVTELIGRAALADRVLAAAGLHALRDEIRSSALGDHDEWSVAGSLELAASVARLNGTAGIRADRLVSGTVVASPAVSAAWSVDERLRLRSSGGRAFRSPTWTERYYVDPGHTGNPDLEAEQAWSWELGTDLYPLERARFGASAFIRKAENLIDWARPEPTAGWVTRNVESATFRGIEADLEVRDLLGANVLARASWLSLSSSSAAGLESKYALRPQTDSYLLSLDRALAGPVRLGVRATRERRLEDAGYTLVDARAVAELSELRLWLDLRNVLDETYQDISRNPAPGRNLYLGLEWRPVL